MSRHAVFAWAIKAFVRKALLMRVISQSPAIDFTVMQH